MSKNKEIKIGEKYYYYTILEEVEKQGRQVVDRYLCQCECGNTFILTSSQIKAGSKKSCGCKAKASFKEYNKKISEKNKISIGTRFGKLVVIEDLGYKQLQNSGHKRRSYRCKCDCGNEIITYGNRLKNGTISCGHCLISKGEYYIKELLKENNILFLHDYLFKDIKKETGHNYRFDFIILNEYGCIDRIVEFDGRQHYDGPDTPNWSNSTQTLEDIQKSDQEKNNYCFVRNIPIIRLPYYILKKKEKIQLQDIFSDKYLVKGE